MNKDAITQFLIRLATSKTITFNTLLLAVAGLMVTYLNTKGIVGLSEDDCMKILLFLGGVVNIVIRFFTKKPLIEPKE
jgi:hypothetical protein